VPLIVGGAVFFGAALDVADYTSAISWASQTALRDVIGKTMLSDMLEGREKISDELQKIIDVRTEPWGINVISVEVKDVLIPSALEDAMSMQAQAERERQARNILGQAETEISEKFSQAALTYQNNPVALHLRASRNIGVDPHDIAEVLLHVAVYAGVPAANTAFSLAKQVFDQPASVPEKGDSTKARQEDA